MKGEEVYKFRCAYLHEGSEVQSKDKELSDVIERFRFDTSRQHHLNPEKTEKQKTIAWLDPGTFCLDICTQVENWEKKVLSKYPDMQTRAEKLLNIYHRLSLSGIASTIEFGTPTVTQSEAPPA